MSRLTQEQKEDIHDLIIEKLGLGSSLETIKGAIDKSVRSRLPVSAKNDSDKLRDWLDFLSDLGDVSVADPLKAILVRAANLSPEIPEAHTLRELGNSLPDASPNDGDTHRFNPSAVDLARNFRTRMITADDRQLRRLLYEIEQALLRFPSEPELSELRDIVIAALRSAPRVARDTIQAVSTKRRVRLLSLALLICMGVVIGWFFGLLIWPTLDSQQVAFDLLKQNDWPVQVNSFNDTVILQVSPNAAATARWGNLLNILKSSKTPIDLDLTEYADAAYSIAVLPEIECLHTLRIRRNKNLITWQWLSGFKSLRRLFLTECDGVRPFLSSEGDARQPLTNLQVLGLDGSADWSESLDDFACFPNLTDLDISGRTIKFSLKGIDKLKYLTTLRIANSREIEMLQNISEHSSLRVLTLDRSSFPNGEIPEIQGFSRRDSVAGIEFERMEITSQ